MIENPFPKNWQDLQDGVFRIFNEIGLSAEINKTVETPRGQIELDVYAIDKNSIEKIRYIVECKNWSKTIPQTVVHAFSTVMQEVGANIGYIISKKGLQKGAKQYTNFNNIKGLTYVEFQKQYFPIWFERFFIPKLKEFSDALIQYVEPINSRRFRYLDQLDTHQLQQFNLLLERYQLFGFFLVSIGYGINSSGNVPEDITNFKKDIAKTGMELQAEYFSELLIELENKIEKITNMFNAIFGKNIFAQHL